MLQLAGDLRGYKLIARDGEIGKAEEFYFDDQSWAVRYLIANTGGWLGGRQVLISPYALDPARQNDQVLPVDLTNTVDILFSLAGHSQQCLTSHR